MTAESDLGEVRKTGKGYFILQVGTTETPLIKAVNENVGTGKASDVYILFGRKMTGQDEDPFDIAGRVKSEVEKLGGKAFMCEITNPEDIDGCISSTQDVFKRIAADEYGKITVDITGGTKPMVAALGHTAITSTPYELEFMYTGGQRRDQNGRVISSSMQVSKFDKTILKYTTTEIIKSLRSYHYYRALFYCSTLPPYRLSDYLSDAVNGLVYWDEFNYGGAFNKIRGLGETKLLSQEVEYAPIALLIDKLKRHGQQLLNTVASMKSLSEKNGSALKTWQKLGDSVLLLAADTLENSTRRSKEGRFTDAVLRAYRAVECAVQLSLLNRGISPWKPDYAIIAGREKEYCEKINGRNLPVQLSLYNGYHLLEMTGTRPDADIFTLLDKLSYQRNYCFLEHGYTEIDATTASNCIQWANIICEKVLSKGGFNIDRFKFYSNEIRHTF